ncbi:unnamed protein product [Brassica napus]|nr:unnamed protein product [Brassica napus]
MCGQHAADIRSSSVHGSVHGSGQHADLCVQYMDQYTDQYTDQYGQTGRGKGQHADLCSGEASSATDRAQVPWKGAPERVRAPSCPDPVAPRGAVYESGCLGMQPQSGGKFRPRLNMGERPMANKYRESQRVLEIVGREADGGRRCVLVGCGTEQSGPPIDSGRGPTRIKVVT